MRNPPPRLNNSAYAISTRRAVTDWKREILLCRMLLLREMEKPVEQINAAVGGVEIAADLLAEADRRGIGYRKRAHPERSDLRHNGVRRAWFR